MKVQVITCSVVITLIQHL